MKISAESNGIFLKVKYTLVCCVSLTSWAAQHTTVCLDTDAGDGRTLASEYNAPINVLHLYFLML